MAKLNFVCWFDVKARIGTKILSIRTNYALTLCSSLSIPDMGLKQDPWILVSTLTEVIMGKGVKLC